MALSIQQKVWCYPWAIACNIDSHIHKNGVEAPKKQICCKTEDFVIGNKEINKTNAGRFPHHNTKQLGVFLLRSPANPKFFLSTTLHTILNDYV